MMIDRRIRGKRTERGSVEYQGLILVEHLYEGVPQGNKVDKNDKASR